MDINETTYKIRGAAFKVHSLLGPGLLESIYEKIFIYELEKAGLTVRQQVPVPIIYDNIKFDFNYRIDLIVNEQVIIEIKSVDMLVPVHYKQLLTYLKLMNKKIGLLINFNCISLDKTSMVRIIL